MAAIFGLILASVPMLVTAANQITASVTVSQSCDFDADTSAIGFGPLSEGAQSSVVARYVNLNVNYPAIVKIFGDDWTGTLTGPPIMSVAQTAYDKNLTSGNPTTALALTPGVNLISSSVPEYDLVSYQVTIPNQQTADTYMQHITLDFSCD